MSEPTSPTDAPAPVTVPGAAGPAEVLAPDGVQDPRLAAEGGLGPDGEGAEVDSPAKIIRIGAMIKQLLDEVRNTTLDDASREQLRSIYEHSIEQLKTSLSPELGAELEDLSFDFSGEAVPSDAELRLAKAQLVGWLEGLFHGIQATLMAQQMQARQQLEGMRGQIPERTGPMGPGPGYI
ncbi:MAG: proteasome activator [Microthrixaceae bacterium]